jgi:threonine aldolase
LGCPAGAVLAFTRESYPEVRRLKQLMGGCLRQSGILAAAGLYALENNVERLVEAHQNAKHLAHLLASLPFLEVETRAPSSNMGYFQWKGKYCSAEAFLEKCTRQCVRFSLVGKNRFRAVTHLDISREDCDTAVRILEKVGDNN